MGIVYKSGISYEQQQVQLQAQETELAIKDLKDSIRNESNTRANDDATLRQDITALHGVVTAEIESRTEAQSQIQADLLTETNQRTAADSELQNAINNEKTAREAAESDLQNEITDAIETEKAERAQAIQDMAAALSVAMGNAQRLQEIENENLRRQMEADSSAQGTTLAALNERVAAEEQTRANEDTKLLNAIAAEETDRKSAVANLQNTLTATINNEVTARQTAVSDLRDDLEATNDTLSDLISGEVLDRKAAVNQLQTNLTNAQSTLNTSISNEVTARQTADNQLQTAFNSAIATETQNRTNALNALDTSLKKYVGDEMASVSESLSDFTAPTANADGKRGLVPAPPKGLEVKILTSNGWRPPDDATLTISVVPSQVGTLTYNGSAQSPTWLNFDNKKLKIEGTTSGTNAQSYTVTFTPLDLYMWADTLDQQPKTATWKIDPLKLAKPTAAVTEFTYNGAAQGITVSNYDSTYESQTGTVSATNVNSYSAVYKLRNTTNTKWSDNSTGDVTISWKINVLKLDKPTAAVTEFTYDGAAKNLSVSNYNSTYENKSGSTSETGAGSYSVVYSLKSTTNTTWADNSVANVTISWKITPLKLTKPSASVTTFTYDGTAKNLSVSNFDSIYESQTGTVSATNANSYSAVYKLKNTTNTCWADNSVADVTISWKIDPLKLTKPSASVTEFTYDGAAKNLSVSNYNSTYENKSGSTSETGAGSYSVVYSLKSTTNTTWADSTTGNVTISWEIKQSVLTAEQSSGFAQIGTLTYNGNSQTVSIKNYDSNYHDLSSTTSAVNAGTYTVKISPKSGMTWNDGTNSAKSVTWQIKPMTLQKPVAATTSFDYDGTTKTLSISNYNSARMTQSGTISASEAGDYQVKYTLNSKTNYIWADSTTADVVIDWGIGSISILKPTAATTTFTYNGSVKNLSVQNYDERYMTQTGTVSETNAGEYRVTYKLTNPARAKWADGTTSNVVIDWKIDRKKLTATQSTFPSTVSSTFSIFYQDVTDLCPNFDENYHSGGAGARDAGIYTANISPKSNYCWSDGTFAPKVVTWTINPLKLTKPYPTQSTFTYDGGKQVLNLENYNSWYLDYRGTDEAKLPGEYSVTCFIIEPENVQWTDNSTDDFIINWKIEAIKLTSAQSTFSQDGTLTYSGSRRYVTISGYDPDCHIRSGSTSEINAGSYTATIAPKTGYVFSDGSTDAKEVIWKIQPLTLDIPTAAETEFAYDGNTKTLSITGYNTSRMTRSGTYSAKAVGNYQVTFTLGDTTNTTWANGSTDPVVIYWSIGLTKVTAPTISTGTFTYDGNSKTPTFSGFDSTYMTMSSDTSAVNAGNYVIKVALKDKTRYCWQDNSTDDLTFSWIINRKKLTSTQSTFSQSGTLNYTGSSQNVTITNYDANYHSLGGVYLSTNAGTFVAKVSPLANYAFSDGTTAAKSVTWTINPIKLTKPTASVTSFAYDKQAHALTISNYNSTYMNQTGTTSATAAGSYSVSFSLKNKTNTTWADSTTGNVIISWSIDKTRLTKPTLATSTFTYNGSNKTVSVQNFNGTYCTQSGVTQAINAGNYSVTISLNDNTLVEWEDASTADVVLSWTIDKAVISSAYSDPSQKTIPTYTGNAINLLSTTYLNGYSSTYQTWSGVTSSTNAGTFTAYVEPKENYTFNDGTTAKKAVTLQIGKAIITPPEISTTTTLTYTGAAQSPTLTGYDANKMTLGSDTSEINAGEYTLTVTPKNSNYVFSTGESSVSLIWSIAPNILYQDFKFTANSAIFNGETQNNAITKLQLPNGSYVDYDSSLFTSSGTLSASNTGVYPVTLTFKDSNYAWGASNNKTLTKNWEIKPCNTVAYPRSQNFTYDGNEHAPYNVATSKFIKVVSGTASASAVGSYTVTYGLKYPAQTSWYQSGGNTDDYTINWSIGLTSITAPAISTNYFDYDGSAKTVTISGFDSNKMTKTGTESATAKGFYTVTISLKDKTGSCWSTGGNADLVLEWAVGKKRVAKPTLAENAVTEFDYSGSAKILNVEGYDANTMTQSGYLSATDAGDYTVSYALKTTTACTYVWQDNSTAKVSFSWKINKKALSAVTFSQSGTLTYDGTAKTVTIKNFNTSTMDISSDTSKTDAGSYTAKITPKANYTWSDGTVTAKSVSWKIKPKTLTKPTASTTNFDYDGTEKTLSISNYNSTYINQAGTISETNAGSYSAIFALKSSTNTIWADSTTDNVVIAWSIGGNYIAVPTISPKSQTSQGLTKTHSVTVTGFDSNTMTQSGTVSANGAAKKYTVTFSLKDKTNTAWVGGGTADKSLNWWVDIRTLTSANSTFTQTTSITCDGNSHSVTEAIGGIKSSYIGEYYTLSGDTTATAAGTYTVTITPTAAAQWSDKTATAKTVQWTIDGAATNLQLEKTSYTASIPATNGTTYLYNEIVTTTTTASPKITVKFTTNSDGDITFTSDDNLVVRHSSRITNTSSGTVAASAGQFTLYPVANGTATITVTQKATSGFNAVTKYLTVTVTAGTILLNWSEIQTLAKNGNLLNYMRIGDVTSAIHLAGTVGTASVSGYKQYKLIGYNHNSGVEGTGKAHFMQLDVLTDSKYDTFADTTANDFVFYYYTDANANRVGYGNATIRNRCTEYFNFLPAALQNVITACKKYFYRDIYNYVSDKIWIPSAYELVGANNGVVPANNGYIEQYEYFANGNSRAFSKKYWTRDTHGFSGDAQSLFINTSGSIQNTSIQKLSYGFLPCFTIG